MHTQSMRARSFLHFKWYFFVCRSLCMEMKSIGGIARSVVPARSLARNDADDAARHTLLCIFFFFYVQSKLRFCC